MVAVAAPPLSLHEEREPGDSYVPPEFPASIRTLWTTYKLSYIQPNEICMYKHKTYYSTCLIYCFCILYIWTETQKKWQTKSTTHLFQCY